MILLILNKFFLMAPSFFGPILVAVSGGEGGHEADHSGPPHLPSMVKFLVDIFGEDMLWAEEWINMIYSLVTAILMTVVVMRVYKRRQMIPGKLQNFVEMCVEGLYNFIESILGENAIRYTPLLGTLFFYILINNLLGILPLGHSPSTDFNVTASLAVIVFFVAQYTGIKRLGFVKYCDHFAGSPRNVGGWILVPLMLPIHLIGEVVKPLSLALRLFGNITGEDILVAAFVGLGITALSFMHSPVGLPLNVPFIFLGILLSTIQALVFTLLSSIYILMMLPHEEHG